MNSPCTSREAIEVQHSKSMKTNIVLFMMIGSINMHISKNTCKAASAAGIDVYAVHYTNSSYINFHENMRKYLYANRLQLGARKMGALFDAIHKGYLDEYSHVWIMDDNVKITRNSIDTMKQAVQNTSALVYQPAIIGSHIPLVRPNNTCSYRYTDYVEIMSPIIETAALQHVLEHLHRTDAYSDWGLDMLWCKWLSASFKIDQSMACAIIDDATATKIRKKSSYSYARALNDKRCTVRHMKRYKTKFHTFSCNSRRIL